MPPRSFEVLMSVGTLALIRMIGVLSTWDPEPIKSEMGEARVRSDPDQSEANLLQMYLFLCFPVALNGLNL